MRSSFTIFLLGLVLGSTLGIGGIWTQVVQPAAVEIQQLNEEHAIMESALNEAGEALREVAGSLRADTSPEPIMPGSIFPGTGPTPTAPTPVTPKPDEIVRPNGGTSFRSNDRTEVADQLETLADKLKAARKIRKR